MVVLDENLAERESRESTTQDVSDASSRADVPVNDALTGDRYAYIDTHARIAVYDDLLSSPRIIDVAPARTLDFIEEITVQTYESARLLGGTLPYTVIREISENFIHADFKECTVSVLNNGNTVRFSDQGPGIGKKELVLLPGVSSATAPMKRYIRGVGSGFPIVNEYLERVNGFLSIDDNAVDGAVITLSIAIAPVASQQLPATMPAPGPVLGSQKGSAPPPTETGTFNQREKQALLLLNERGMLGTNDLAGLLGISAPTATRLLQKLENYKMVETSSSKKRILSNEGVAYVQTLS
ncbi:MAG: hypothetical protein LBD25_06915 [Coriobacteriales bacterium]|jgi:hypothetical protein|nr:hypothetical protein [Coriobacteriales bacterium]